MSEDKHLQHINLRRRILYKLYKDFREYPYAQIELREIEQVCETDTKELNWNIVYLEKCGYVDLGKSTDCYPLVACSASITAQGIDLIENKKNSIAVFRFKGVPNQRYSNKWNGITYPGICSLILFSFKGLAAFFAAAIGSDHTDTAFIRTKGAVFPINVDR